MNDYQQIMSIDSVIPFVVGFSIQGLLSGLQLWLALVFLGSGLINVLRRNDWAWLRYLGAITNIASSEKMKVGLMQLAVGSVLLLPIFYPVSFLVLLMAFVCVPIAIFYFANQPSKDGDNSGRVTRMGFVLFAILGAWYTAYDRQDPIAAIKSFALNVAQWRPKELAWQDRLDVNAPKVGDLAPSFTLLNSENANSESLVDFLGEKPVVLFLGANSCPVFSHGMQDINDLHDKYKNRVNFVGVYVSEPHATDEWPLANNDFMKWVKNSSQHPVAIDIKQHQAFEQRRWAATRLKSTLLNTDIPLLVDGMDNSVNNTWVGRPARIYLLSADGTVLYNPGKGPYSFNPSLLEPVLEEYLASMSMP